MIQLCLDSIRKTCRLNNEIIVIDNNSNDDSVSYLRIQNDIRLIEHHSATNGAQGHKEALDIGTAAATSEWIILLHSDTIFLKTGWDIEFLKLLHEHPDAIGFSSTARDINPFESFYSKIKRRLREREENFSISMKPTHHKIMSYCFGIKKSFLREVGYSFSNCIEDVGTDLYKNHIAQKMPFIRMGRPYLEKILWHTSNTTSIITGQITEQKLQRRFHNKHGQLINALKRLHHEN